MPGGDRTGPRGEGQMTGRKLGYCTGNDYPGYSAGPDFSERGRGLGRGGGQSRNKEGARTVLLKLPKGFKMAPHSHVTTEQHFILEGEYKSNNKTFSSGSYQIFYPQEEHGPFESETGALILVVWDPLKTN